MSGTPGTEDGDAGKSDLRRWIIIGIVVAVGVILVAVIGSIVAFNYLYGGTAPDAPTIDNALQQLLPSAPPE